MLRSALLLLAVLSGVSGARPAPRPQAAGTIEGRVVLKALPPKRVATRYAGSGPGAGGRVQEIPAVVYLRGDALKASAPPATRARMAQRDTTFVPALVVITAGSSVEFPNRDPFFHNVFSYSKTKRFDLGRYPDPEAKTVTFDRPGIVNVFCEIHRSMRGVILVLDNPYFATVAADGSFRIAGVPPGKYELVAWHPDRGERKQPVTVPAAGTVRVNASL